MYEIKPLRWTVIKGVYTAVTLQFVYEVERHDGRWKWNAWNVQNIASEVWPCDSAKDGKQLANQHWQRQISRFLKSTATQ